MPASKVIELNNVFLKSDRGDQLFRDLNLSLDAGRAAVVVGGAGSGKSSLVELLIGARRPDSGSVEAFGELISSGRQGIIRKTRRKIGGVGGLFGLVPSFTVAENITYPLVLKVENRKTIKNSLFKMLTEFSLLQQAGEYPGKLTRVEKTLVQFARAAIANQPLMIIDEPAAGLDSSTFERILDFLARVSLSGRSLLILTSDTLPRDIPNADTYKFSNGALL